MFTDTAGAKNPRWKGPLTFTCEYCGKEFQLKRWSRKGNTQRFCSRRCRHDERMSHRVMLTCKLCGKEFEVVPVLAATRKYCSKKCQLIDQFRNQQRPSKLELQFRDALDKADIPYEFQASVPESLTIIDFLLPNRLAVYTDGDYYHAHPDKYPKAKRNKMQGETQARDARLSAELRAAGYTVLRFWGSDIRADLPACIATVKAQLALMAE